MENLKQNDEIVTIKEFTPKTSEELYKSRVRTLASEILKLNIDLMRTPNKPNKRIKTKLIKLQHSLNYYMNAIKSGTCKSPFDM